MQRRDLSLALGLLPVLAALPAAARAEEHRHDEEQEHPRIAAAIHELEGAIQYMEAAPLDFGGHKVEAIRASRRAVAELRRALAYRARRD